MELFHASVLAIHVMTAGLLFSFTAFSAYLLSQKTLRIGIFDYAKRVIQRIPLIVGIQFLTGFYLVGVEWEEFAENKFFWVKMVLVFIHGALAKMMLEKSMKDATENSDGTVTLKQGMKNWGYIGVVLFAVIITIAVFMVELGE